MKLYTKHIRFLALLCIVATSSCGKKKKATPTEVVKTKKKSETTQKNDAASAKDNPQKSEVLFTERDFIESPDNRDPFHNYFNDFIAPKPQQQQQQSATIQRDVILPRYGVDELILVAIVSGGVRSRAMFRDPTGLGVSVKRGDYMGKSANRVKEILSDAIVLEVMERSGSDKTADRVIRLHQNIPEANFGTPEKKTN